MGIVAWIEQEVAPAANMVDSRPVLSRVFHAAAAPGWTLCRKSTNGLTRPPAGFDSWPPDLGKNGTPCPTCETRVQGITSA